MAIFLLFVVIALRVSFSRQDDLQNSNSSDVPALLTDTKNAEFLRFIFQGLPGRDGRDGRDGHDGHDGHDGLPAPQEQECQGMPGPQGPSGVDGIPGERGEPGQCPQCPPPPGNAGTSGAVYIRWGRTTCPSMSELAYAGIAGGKWYGDEHSGSGSNYLCLPEDPEYDDYQAGAQSNRALVYSAEYQVYSDFPPYAGKHDHDATCAVCRTTNRGSVIMIPAKMTCPSGWTREYHGYLMAECYTNYSSEFVCVDRSPEVVTASSGNKDGALFYPVEGRCNYGNLPCAPYINGAELTCVVCSK